MRTLLRAAGPQGWGKIGQQRATFLGELTARAHHSEIHGTTDSSSQQSARELALEIAGAAVRGFR